MVSTGRCPPRAAEAVDPQGSGSSQVTGPEARRGVARTQRGARRSQQPTRWLPAHPRVVRPSRRSVLAGFVPAADGQNFRTTRACVRVRVIEWAPPARMRGRIYTWPLCWAPTGLRLDRGAGWLAGWLAGWWAAGARREGASPIPLPIHTHPLRPTAHPALAAPLTTCRAAACAAPAAFIAPHTRRAAQMAGRSPPRAPFVHDTPTGLLAFRERGRRRRGGGRGRHLAGDGFGQ